MLIDAVIARIEQAIPQLDNRVKGGLDLAEMMRRKALPNYTPAAFVVDNGISGRAAQAAASMFLQDAEETVSVVLILRTAGDVTGARGQPTLTRLKWQVILALAGFAPELEAVTDGDEELVGEIDPVGVLVLRRGRVNSLEAGTVYYQLDFALQQQVRVVA